MNKLLNHFEVRLAIVIIVVALALSLVGCDEMGTLRTPNVMMSNDQIIAETKKCNDAGLGASLRENGIGTSRHIVCIPK